jgi:hypothetical protein
VIRLDPPRVTVAAGMPLTARVAVLDDRQVITLTDPRGYLVGDFTGPAAMIAAGVDLTDVVTP